MVFALPMLPYAFDALEPVISKEIVEVHYTKHHQGYVNNLNAAIEKLSEAEKKEDLNAIVTLQSAIAFNGGGNINHSLYWENLSPMKDKKEISKELLTQIEKDFSSFENMKKILTQQSIAIPGSGWGFLAYNPIMKRLEIVISLNHGTATAEKLIPLIVIDVWEHAYYLQYKNLRKDYCEKIWDIFNWKVISDRYSAAIKGN